MMSTIAMTPSRTPMRDRAQRVEHRVAGEQREPDAQQREHQPDQRAEVLQQHDRQLRRAWTGG